MIKKEILDKILADKLAKIQNDGMTVFLLGDGDVRGAFFNGTKFINQMKVQHDLGVLETLTLGHACLCAALLIPMMKGNDRTVFRCDTNGVIKGFSVEAFSEGFVRGYLLQDKIVPKEELKTWNLKPLFGEGNISVVRFPEGAKEPITGITKIKHKNIASDLSEYFLQSEQTVTGFNTGIQFDKDGRVIGAGGMYIQIMPNADDAIVKKAESAFSAIPSIGQWFSENGDREDIIFGLFRNCNPQVLIERSISFHCLCSEEMFKQKLQLLPKNELEEMYTENNNFLEVKCHNCSSVYKIPKS